MNLHEYQSKQRLRDLGVAVPEGRVARAATEVPALCAELGGTEWIIKAQVHAGGRGKAGGVVRVNSSAAAERETRRLLGSRLRTAQTGPTGLPVAAVLIERPTPVARELYLSLLLDRAAEQLLFMASDAGGVEIERIAAESPERLLVAHVHPAAGPQAYQARRLGFRLGLTAAGITALAALMRALYRLYQALDATLIELNPLAVTTTGELLALDAKIALDDNALYRHADLLALRDLDQEDAREAVARAHDLNYVSLDGNIGCMVNGAGLAMATMDLVKLYGGAPANFLDVGGGATAARVAEAFKLILSDAQVDAVLVNIFGGIVRCDLIAEGIIQAVREVQVAVPLVVRLEGTNAVQGRALLAASGLQLTTADSLETAADRVVAAAAQRRSARDAAPAVETSR